MCTVRWGFLRAKASNLGEKTTSSMFLTMKLRAVSLRLWLEQVSEISKMSRALDELRDASIWCSQNLWRKGMSYLSAAKDREYTCFSAFSFGRLPLYKNSSRDSTSSWFSSLSVIATLAGALHSSESRMFLKISDLAA